MTSLLSTILHPVVLSHFYTVPNYSHLLYPNTTERQQNINFPLLEVSTSM